MFFVLNVYLLLFKVCLVVVFLIEVEESDSFLFKSGKRKVSPMLPVAREDAPSTFGDEGIPRKEKKETYDVRQKEISRGLLEKWRREHGNPAFNNEASPRKEKKETFAAREKKRSRGFQLRGMTRRGRK